MQFRSLKLVPQGERLKASRDDSPGPGQYKSEIVDLKKSFQSYKWGKSNRFNSKLSNGTPGPGLYGTQSGLKGPKYGFGTGQRYQLKVNLHFI